MRTSAVPIEPTGRHRIRVVDGHVVVDADDDRSRLRHALLKHLVIIPHEGSIRVVLGDRICVRFAADGSVFTDPGYTNSTVISEHTWVKAAVFPPFFSSSKARLYLSGHAHGYERFIERDKQIVVAGGGGGPRFGVRTGERARRSDQFVGPPIRPFHYLLMDASRASLHVTVRGLDEQRGTFEVIDHFP